MQIKIPVYEPLLNGNEKNYVIDCLQSNWISSKGKYIKEFEDKFSDYINVKYSTTTCNGTAALHLALVTLGIGKGDEVILPAFSYIAVASSVIYTGAEPVFVDSLRSTWQINPDNIKNKITSKTKAIIAVHLYGHPCEMNQLKDISGKYNLFLIEDCAEAFGSKFEDKYVGTFGDISAFSFYGNKTITTGEGGMLVTNDKNLYKRANLLKMHGVSPVKQYWHDIVGFNYRMTNICAAIGLAQLEKADEHIKMKRRIAQIYNEKLKNLPVEFHTEANNVYHTYWMYSILVDNLKTRNELRKYLEEFGIETRPTFYPINMMPMFSHNYEKMIVAEDIALRGMNLPSHPSLSIEEIEYICEKIADYFKKNGN